MSAQERIEVEVGDITRLQVDAIVNAANSRLIPGGGVDGAINRAAGPELARAMAELGGCPTGSARITPGFALPAAWVIHAVGPRWHGGEQGEADLLTGAYRASLELATEKRLESLAFPAISTGIYGYPPEAAAEIAVTTVTDWLAAHAYPARVILCAFDAATAARYRGLLGKPA